MVNFSGDVTRDDCLLAGALQEIFSILSYIHFPQLFNDILPLRGQDYWE
jgi:hypothetical protein